MTSLGLASQGLLASIGAVTLHTATQGFIDAIAVIIGAPPPARTLRVSGASRTIIVDQTVPRIIIARDD